MTRLPDTTPYATRMLVVDPAAARIENRSVEDLPELLRAGDLLVLNDAATLPASLAGYTARREPVEVRLLGPERDGLFSAVLLGAGDFHTRTEDRPAPPPLSIGDKLQLGPLLSAAVVGHSELSARFIQLQFNARGAALWAALYAWGKPVQYAYHTQPLPLWSVQTAYASRPWASEMPSAGRPLRLRLLTQLRQRGVGVAVLTHAAGLSSTGDPVIDRALPLPERYDIPESTVQAIAATRRSGGRVVAVGTSVVRALEDSALRGGGRVLGGESVASLRISPEHRRQVVDGLLTGIHSPEESHYALLGAFVDNALLSRSLQYARTLGYREHEFGDASLVLGAAVGVTRSDRRAA